MRSSADRSKEEASMTISGRAKSTDQVLFLDRAVLAIKQRERRTDYTRSELVLEGALHRAAEILGEPVPSAA
jgi:hypothetical protein